MSGQATLFAAQTALVENPPPPEPANTDHAPATGGTDLVCFSHLRWNFVYQRPQHLLLALRPRRHARLLCRGARLRRRGRARLESQFRRGRGHGRGAAPAARARCRGPGRGAARAGRPAVPRAGHRATRCSGTTRRWRSPSRASLEPARGRLRLHGRAVGVPRRAARAARARARAARRAPTWCSPAARASTRPSATPARATSTPSRAASTSPHFGQARAAAARAGRPGRDPAPAARLLRGDRRAAWISTCWPRSPTPAPTGSSCMVGPVVKIDPATLPRRPNIHYLG